MMEAREGRLARSLWVTARGDVRPQSPKSLDPFLVKRGQASIGHSGHGP